MRKREEKVRQIFTNPLTIWGIGVLISVITIILFDRETGSKLFTIAEYFLFEYDYKTMEYGILFSTVFMLRMPILVLLILSSNIKNWERIGWCVCLMHGFSMGYMLMILCLKYGVRGLILCLLMWTPHMFFYFFSLYQFVLRNRMKWQENVGVALCYIIGILGEVFLNPILLSSLSHLM